ncbi:MAG TPA: MFS transporter [Jatrophihabitans sp.]|nr:MFS transporter [Jatrophihabitans sp.]
MIAAIVLTGLTMRIAVTSVGSVLDDLQLGLHASSGIAGIITTLPVIAFAGMGFAGPALAHRFGEHQLVALALLLATLGLAARAAAGSVWLFGLLSLLALAGGAIANVLMPTLVKRHFPDRIGPMTAAYTTSLAIGSTAAAGLSVPVAHALGSWRWGVGVWAVLTAVAILPWLPTLRGDRPAAAGTVHRLPIARLARTKLGWAMVLMFGTQSMQAYIAFGWFAKFFRDHHVRATEAGLLVAFYASLAIPISAFIPNLAARFPRGLVLVLAVTNAACYLGMLLAPAGGAWGWMLLGGIGSGFFPLSLTLIGLRSRQIPVTAALSAFTQGLGYIIAGSGPLLVGLLLDVTGDDWTGPVLLLLAANAVTSAFAWYLTRNRFVDDELAVTDLHLLSSRA